MLNENAEFRTCQQNRKLTWNLFECNRNFEEKIDTVLDKFDPGNIVAYFHPFMLPQSR